MLFWERLAEEKILQALARGELNDLPGRGKPIPEEPGMQWVPEELRSGYRLLKNAGYVPEEVSLLLEIDDLVRLLGRAEAIDGGHAAQEKRLQLLLSRLGDLRGGSLRSADYYYQRVIQRFDQARGTAEP